MVEPGEVKEIETYENEYRNLMVLLNDRIYLENFGECGGQGRCGTCVVRVEDAQGSLSSERSRNETRTLEKNEHQEKNIRLSCQILVAPNLHGATIYLEESV